MHACMLSRFSRVQLCATLWTAAHQAPPSTGFSKQEYWSRLPFPSPSKVTYRLLFLFSLYVMSDTFATPWTVDCQLPLSIFPRQEYWSGLPFPPLGDLPNPRIKPRSVLSPLLPADTLSLSHQQSPYCSIVLSCYCMPHLCWLEFKCLSNLLELWWRSALLLFSHSAESNSLWPHGLQYTRLPCPLLFPGFCANPCPLSWWCHPSISHSVLILSSAFSLSQHQGLSNESILHIKWPKYWSFSISPSKEYSGLISFRMDWLDLLAVQGTLKSLLQHHRLKASILQLQLWGDFKIICILSTHKRMDQTLADRFLGNEYW